jgi:predicted glutamine amidotransferase
MCGLVGVIGAIGAVERAAFEKLLIFDQVRGKDSTGVAVIGADGEASIIKRLGSPDVILDSREYSAKASRANNLALIGHNRFATQGGVSAVNAHPFEIGKIVGAHNGTIHNKDKLGFDGKSHPVDSFMLYEHLSHFGVRETISKLNSYSDAYALTWWDSDNETMNFLRNEDRPLFFAETSDCLFWASEAWMLEGIRNKPYEKMYHRSGKLTFLSEPYQLTEDFHVSVSVSGLRKLGKPVGRTIKQSFPPIVSSGNRRLVPTNVSSENAKDLGASGKKAKKSGVSSIVCLLEYRKDMNFCLGQEVNVDGSLGDSVGIYNPQNYIEDFEKELLEAGEEGLFVECTISINLRNSSVGKIKYIHVNEDIVVLDISDASFAEEALRKVVNSANDSRSERLEPCLSCGETYLRVDLVERSDCFLCFSCDDKLSLPN